MIEAKYLDDRAILLLINRSLYEIDELDGVDNRSQNAGGTEVTFILTLGADIMEIAVATWNRDRIIAFWEAEGMGK